MTSPRTPSAVMKILTGPPGTGKTYRAVREAVHAIDPTVPELEVLNVHTDLQKEGRIVWLTFHPSYTYEDFVEGIRPVEDGKGNTLFRTIDGPFKKICKLHRTRLILSGDILMNAKRPPKPNYEVVYSGDDGISVVSYDDRASIVNRSAQKFIPMRLLEFAKRQGLDPEIFAQSGGSPTEIREREEAAHQLNLSPTDLINASHIRAAYNAYLNPPLDRAPVPIVLVIDEINRADLSRVFGELMTLLELDKREGATEEKRITLPYSGEQFTVPATLSIIGTMNTADRSLAVLDYALRRRFTFVEVMPDPNLCAGSYGGLNLGAYLTWMNRVLTALLSRDNQIGHVDLMEPRLEEVRGQEGYTDDDDGRLRAVAWTLRHKIAPLLLEYFHEDWRLASRVLGDKGVDALLIPQDFSDVAALDNNLDIRSSYEMEDWWNPTSMAWDEERFKRYMSAISSVGVPVTSSPAASVPTVTPPTPTTVAASPAAAPAAPMTPAAATNPADPDQEDPDEE
ncbi:hypothetical protein D3875_03485 [Deinococcus cavernae]|uniref:ATPase dynein-related AAA domain-containing protein n=1 Tax=Deinococcus cavernae TaxID=2320857 RepID=A0A418VEU8_9DEIO|nr:AAA family ATPase [Deinococcus cavernae]RJF74616.1 hypothetical protein D3875_03485 [Deinococcus cavernae]